jgi:hypothetical protein
MCLDSQACAESQDGAGILRDVGLVQGYVHLPVIFARSSQRLGRGEATLALRRQGCQ